MEKNGTLGVFVGVAISGLALAGCTPNFSGPTEQGDSASETRAAPGFAQFPDIAVPAGATMDVDRSLVLGARENWIGRLSMNVSGDPSETYDFFLREMPKFKWQEITTVRSEVSVLTYSRDNRVATIQISKRTLRGSAVDITVSPRGRPSPLSNSFGTMPAAPAGAVDSAPAR
jgi:hypothetical protein